MLSIKGGTARLAYTLKAGLSNNGCGHAGETWNPVIVQPTKLSESALPTCDGKSREHLGSHQSLFHVGRLNKHGQMSEKDRKCRNNINTLTGKKWRQADKSAQLLSGTSLFLGHWQQGAAHSETSQLSYFLVEKSPQTGPQSIALTCISHQADNEHQPPQACGCFIGCVLLHYDSQNPDCVSGLPRKAVGLLLFCASVVQLYCLSNSPSSCRCLSLSVLISTGTVDSTWSW